MAGEHHRDVAAAGQVRGLLDPRVRWLPAQLDVPAADSELREGGPGGATGVVEQDADRTAGAKVGLATDRERRTVEHLAELPLPGGDHDPVDDQPADAGGHNGEAV